MIAQIADEKVKQRSLVDINALCIQNNVLFEGSFFGRRKTRLGRRLMNAMLQGSLHCISEALVRPPEENWRIAASLSSDMLETDELWVREKAGHFPTIPLLTLAPIRDKERTWRVGLERLIRELVNRLKCVMCCKMRSLIGCFLRPLPQHFKTLNCGALF